MFAKTFARTAAVLVATLSIGLFTGASANAAPAPAAQGVTTTSRDILTSTVWYEHLETFAPEYGGGFRFTVSPDGTVDGQTGCNSVHGRLFADTKRIDVQYLGATRRACEGFDHSNEQRLVTALHDAKSYEIVGRELRITTASGEIVTFYNRG